MPTDLADLDDTLVVSHWSMISDLANRVANRDGIPFDAAFLSEKNLFDSLICPSCALIERALWRYMGYDPATERCDHEWVCARCGMVKS